jgi:hypothetical protein
VVVGYSSLAAIEATEEKMRGDEAFRKGAEAFYSMPGLPYQRISRSWLRVFDTMPLIEVPPTEGIIPACLRAARLRVQHHCLAAAR